MAKGKKNIWKFVREHWYLVANIVIVVLIIILTIVFFVENTPNSQSKFKNQVNSCQSNTENYITDIVGSFGDKCPDGYYNVDITGNVPLKVADDEWNWVKLCYKQPDQICKGDLITTNLNMNIAQPAKYCQSKHCQGDVNSSCAYQYVPDGSVKAKTETVTYPSVGCRCKNCGDVPIGHYDAIYDSDGKIIQTGAYNSACSGNLGWGENKDIMTCMSQAEYGSNNKGISDIIYSDDPVSGYTNVPDTNIFFK